MISSLFHYTFLQHAVLASILASIICGVIGTMIVEKRLVMMSGGIAHTAFGGIGLGYFLGVEPIITAFIFSIAAALGISRINRKLSTHTDVVIGMFWAVGMSLGVLFIAFTPGYPPDMSSYLFGDILAVSSTDLLLMLVLAAIILFVIGALFNLFKAYLFDEEFASVLKIHTVFLEYLMLILIALSVVVLIRVMGIILVIALLTIPVAAVKLFTYDLKKIMMYSMILGASFCFFGLWISYTLGIASGAAIALLSGLVYMACPLVRKLCFRRG